MLKSKKRKPPIPPPKIEKPKTLYTRKQKHKKTGEDK
jgi:hypothetical protein